MQAVLYAYGVACTHSARACGSSLPLSSPLISTDNPIMGVGTPIPRTRGTPRLALPPGGLRGKVFLRAPESYAPRDASPLGLFPLAGTRESPRPRRRRPPDPAGPQARHAAPAKPQGTPQAVKVFWVAQARSRRSGAAWTVLNPHHAASGVGGLPPVARRVPRLRPGRRPRPPTPGVPAAPDMGRGRSNTRAPPDHPVSTTPP